MIGFTRREKITLLVGGVIGIAFILFPWLLDPDYELLYLLFIVLPLGVLLATDKERPASQIQKDDDNA